MTKLILFQVLVNVSTVTEILLLLNSSSRMVNTYCPLAPNSSPKLYFLEVTYDGGITKQAVTLKFSNKFEYLVMLDEQPFDNYKVTNDPTRGRRTLYFAPY